MLLPVLVGMSGDLLRTRTIFVLRDRMVASVRIDIPSPTRVQLGWQKDVGVFLERDKAVNYGREATISQ
jgi:hypothetical protein